MTITNVNNPDELQNKLEQKLKAFMENNEPFNVQGSWTGDDNITVTAIIDFGVQDRDDGDYYVANVSARFEDNYEAVLGEEKARELIEQNCTLGRENDLRAELQEKLAESDSLMEAENSIIRAIRTVFSVGPYHNTHPYVMSSDIDMCATIPICYSEWDTRDSIDFNREDEEQ